MKTPWLERDNYEVLGVSRDATILDIDAAWQKKLREHAPSNLQGMGARALAQAEIDRINSAYQTLSNPQTRNRYDRLLAMRAVLSAKSNQATRLEKTMSKKAELANDCAIEYWKQGRFEEAIAQWKTVLQTDPSIAEIHHNLGNAYAYQGKLDHAIESLKQAIATDATLIEAYNKLGCIYYKQEKLELAYASWRQALKIDPNFKEALHNLRLIQHMIPLDAEGEIPAYQHASPEEAREERTVQDEDELSWKERFRQRLKRFVKA
jgi:tetratricopeptide (TPR) repeat protein